jgi:hypothetical protein
MLVCVCVCVCVGKKKAVVFSRWIPRTLSALLAAIDRESDALRVSAFTQTAELCVQLLSNKLLPLETQHLRVMLLLFEVIPARLPVVEEIVLSLYSVAYAMAKHRFSTVQHLLAPYLTVVRKLSAIPFRKELESTVRLSMAQNISRLLEEVVHHRVLLFCSSALSRSLSRASLALCVYLLHSHILALTQFTHTHTHTVSLSLCSWPNNPIPFVTIVPCYSPTRLHCNKHTRSLPIFVTACFPDSLPSWMCAETRSTCCDRVWMLRWARARTLLTPCALTFAVLSFDRCLLDPVSVCAL